MGIYLMLKVLTRLHISRGRRGLKPAVYIMADPPIKMKSIKRITDMGQLCFTEML